MSRSKRDVVVHVVVATTGRCHRTARRITILATAIITFVATGLVPRFPSAILASALVLVACLSQACGLILDSVSRGRKEVRRLAYLSIPAPPAL